MSRALSHKCYVGPSEQREMFLQTKRVFSSKAQWNLVRQQFVKWCGWLDLIAIKIDLILTMPLALAFNYFLPSFAPHSQTSIVIPRSTTPSVCLSVCQFRFLRSNWLTFCSFLVRKKPAIYTYYVDCLCFWSNFLGTSPFQLYWLHS